MDGVNQNNETTPRARIRARKLQQGKNGKSHQPKNTFAYGIRLIQRLV
jgi:hypothetical protein